MTTLERRLPRSPRFPRLSRALTHLSAVLPAALAPILNEPVDRDRRNRRYDMDDTVSASPSPPDRGTFRASGDGINFPAVFFFWTVAQLIGGVWWAATMQANVNTLTQENTKLWNALAARTAKDDAQDLVISHTENGLDERIRNKAREVLSDWGYIHVPRKGE